MSQVQSADGVPIHYEVGGEGKPLLLVHGYAMGARRWRDVGYVDALSAAYRVLTVDLRGHGESACPHGFESYALDSMVGDLLEVLGAERIDRAHYWGYSLGARIGRSALAAAPSRFERAILGGSGPMTVSGAIATLLRERGIEGFVAAMGPNLTEQAREFFLRNDAEALASLSDAQVSWGEPAAPHPHPTLVYAGEDDPAYAATRQYAESLPNATFVSLPGANHGMAFAKSELILERAIGFLRG